MLFPLASDARRARGSSEPHPFADQIALCMSLICDGARWNAAACGANQKKIKRRFALLLEDAPPSARACVHETILA